VKEKSGKDKVREIYSKDKKKSIEEIVKETKLSPSTIKIYIKEIEEEKKEQKEKEI
jgi:uncharacterized alkaline shock family protein YloU